MKCGTLSYCLLAAMLTLLAVGCDGEETSSDAGTSGGMDAGTQAGEDSGTSSDEDGGSQEEEDAGEQDTDAGPPPPPMGCTKECELHADCQGGGGWGGMQCVNGVCRRYQCSDDSSCFSLVGPGFICIHLYGHEICRRSCDHNDDCPHGHCGGTDDDGRRYCVDDCNDIWAYSGCGLLTCESTIGLCSCSSTEQCGGGYRCEPVTPPPSDEADAGTGDEDAGTGDEDSGTAEL